MSPYPSSDGQIEVCHSTARRIYWEKADRSIVGPATPLFLARYAETFIVIVEYRGDMISINSTVLRSKKEFQSRRKPQVVEPIRELRR